VRVKAEGIAHPSNGSDTRVRLAECQIFAADHEYCLSELVTDRVCCCTAAAPVFAVSQVEDRPIVKERVETIVEHRPVEKEYVTELR